MIAATLLSGCTAPTFDPSFASLEVIESAGADCPSGSLCVEVVAPVIGKQEGEGLCSLYGPGDPDDLLPVARSEKLEMRPGDVTVWATEVSSELAIHDLNPICNPMVEG